MVSQILQKLHGFCPLSVRYIKISLYLRGFLHVPLIIRANLRLNSRNSSLTFLYAGYIGEFEEVDDHRSGKIVIQLNGRYVSVAQQVNIRELC